MSSAIEHSPERIAVDVDEDGFVGRARGAGNQERPTRLVPGEVAYVREDLHWGAVAALRKYGWHDGVCPATFVDDPGPCACGWDDAATTYLGGQSGALRDSEVTD